MAYIHTEIDVVANDRRQIKVDAEGVVTRLHFMDDSGSRVTLNLVQEVAEYMVAEILRGQMKKELSGIRKVTIAHGIPEKLLEDLGIKAK
jgi:hypothetical protein